MNYFMCGKGIKCENADEFCNCRLTACNRNIQVVDMNKINKQIEDLQAENASLTEQLKNSVRLPCKVGDTVFADKNTLRHTSNLSQKRIEAKVIGFTLGRQKMFKIKYETLEKDGYIIHGYERFPFSAIGKTIFLTRPEAEAELKQLEVRSDRN